MYIRIGLLLFILTMGCMEKVQAKKETFSYFSSDPHLLKNNDDYYWIINGQKVICDSTEVKIKIHKDGFDTLIYHSKSYAPTGDTILTKFKNNEHYIFSIGCCASGFDVHLKSRYVKMNRELELYPEAFDSIYLSSFEKGRVKIEIKNMKVNDTLIGIYGDYSAAAMPEGIFFATNKTLEVSTEKGFYSTNVDQLMILKKTPEMKEIGAEYPNVVLWDFNPLENAVIYKWAKIRLFDRNEVKVTYDAQKNEWEIKLEK
jgi:hypothetical protein